MFSLRSSVGGRVTGAPSARHNAAARSSRTPPSFSRVMIAVALTAGMATQTTVLAPSAFANVNATVRAQTQRMSDANLGSHQEGSYNPGDQLTLVCSKRGQKVKGFFSFNIPGGWDNLWYQTTDGHFVADVDIETGTLGVVVPECPTAAAPAAASASAPATQGRTSGATIGGNPLSDYEGYCTWGAQEKVHDNTGYYIKALTGNAQDWANQARQAGWTVVLDAQPRSIAVFSSSVVGGVGHVAWVDAVNGKNVTITEMNMGPGATPQNGYRTTGFHKFDTRTVRDVPGMSYILIP